jgi:uncharacterized membrane protein
MEFVDVNPSLGRLVGPERKSPWRTTTNTIIGQTALCVRYMDDEGLIIVRAVTGIEMFQMIGWDFSFFKRPIAATSVLLGNMAGYAFSGFACMPALMALLSGLGALTVAGIDARVQELTSRAALGEQQVSDAESRF